MIFCIIDGMTDPGFRAADYPNLSRLRLTRYVDTCRGLPPESLGCILHHLGIDRIPPHLRGYAEALGAGIAVHEGDLVLRGSWFSVDGQGCCGAPVPGPRSLSIPGVQYASLGQYKSILVLPGAGGDIDRIVTKAPCFCAGASAECLRPRGSEALEELFRRCLGPGRCLIPWAQSVRSQLPPFPQPAAVISGTTVVRGIGRLLGMEVLEVPGATGEVDTDLLSKTRAALEAAERFPFVLLHINGADEAGHRRDRAEKCAFLQKIDSQVLPLLLASHHALTVTSDHGTDPATGLHLGPPQPIYER